jgi:hypothetical protein
MRRPYFLPESHGIHHLIELLGGGHDAFAGPRGELNRVDECHRSHGETDGLKGAKSIGLGAQPTAKYVFLLERGAPPQPRTPPFGKGKNGATGNIRLVRPQKMPRRLAVFW